MPVLLYRIRVQMVIIYALDHLLLNAPDLLPVGMCRWFAGFSLYAA